MFNCTSDEERDSIADGVCFFLNNRFVRKLKDEELLQVFELNYEEDGSLVEVSSDDKLDKIAEINLKELFSDESGKNDYTMTAVNQHSHHYIDTISDGTPETFYSNLL